MKIFVLSVAVLASLVIIGCVSKNPAYTPPVPGQTNTEPQFIPDPRLTSLSNTVAQIAGGIAPVNPYAGITDWAVKGVFGIVGAIAAAAATAKNKNAVIDTLAAGVVKAGAAAPVLDHASTTNAYAAVANAINDQTGANQTATGTPKT